MSGDFERWKSARQTFLDDVKSHRAAKSLADEANDRRKASWGLLQLAADRLSKDERAAAIEFEYGEKK